MTIDDILTRDHRGLSVLIIDDNKFTRDLLRKILVSFGISDVTAAANAETLPIIMLTAHADEKLVMASLKAGANGYLVKPLIPKRLMALVAKLCRSTLPTLRCLKHG